MDAPKEELTRRPLYVYDLPKNILSTLEHKEGAAIESTETEEPEAPKDGDGPKEKASGSLSCSLCGLTFPTLEDQKGHSRSDFHNYNLKLRLRGSKPLSENEFETLVKDLDESLSGSDDSSSEDDEPKGSSKETTLSALLKKQATISHPDSNEVSHNARGKKQTSGSQPLLWFTTPVLPKNTYLSIYRTLFHPSSLSSSSSLLSALREKQLPPKPVPKLPSDGIPPPGDYRGPHFFLCMMGGGHFAAMIVSLAPRLSKSSSSTGPLAGEAVILAHKTFHRYTTRRKQGGAQSANDSAKGAAHSAGSTLRRYNEQALSDEIRLLLADWKPLIDTSELLFIRATGNTNRRTLFGPYENQVLRLNDDRIRGFPFNTRRATQNELLRAFVELTRVKVQEIDFEAIAAKKQEEEMKAKQAAEAKAAAKAAAKPAVSQRSEEEETALMHTTQILALMKRSRVPALLQYLNNNGLGADFELWPKEQHHHAPTPLHVAASMNSAPLVFGLLGKAGANPEMLNGDGKTAFELSGDRATRDAFRVARSELGEERWNWDAAKVPVGITREEAEERDAREKEEEKKAEEARRKAEKERLEREGPRVKEGEFGKKAERIRQAVLGKMGQTAEEKRMEEAKGLTPEMRQRLERERRARAAEERIRRMQGGG